MALFKRQSTEKKTEKTWFKDKYQTTLVQRNILAVFTVISLLAAVLSAFAMQRLAPLKSVEPFVIQIDEKSGITELVQPMTREKLTSPEHLDDYFLWRYVVARETYDAIDPGFRMETVRVLSAPKVFEAFRAEISPANDSSPAHMLGEFGSLRVENPTIQHLNDPKKLTAIVRYSTVERFRNTERTYFRTATVDYSYNDIDLNRDERLINPLGFQVKGYRRDEETLNR